MFKNEVISSLAFPYLEMIVLFLEEVAGQDRECISSLSEHNEVRDIRVLLSWQQLCLLNRLRLHEMRFSQGFSMVFIY